MIEYKGEQWRVIRLVDPDNITVDAGPPVSGAVLFGWTEDQIKDLRSNFALFQGEPPKAYRVRPSGIYTCPQIGPPFYSLEDGERIDDSSEVYELIKDEV